MVEDEEDELDKLLDYVLEGRSPFQMWYQLHVESYIDLLYKAKETTFLFPYILQNSPRRWYPRLVFGLFTPSQRNTIKFFFPICVDYESLMLGTAFGLFLVYRHYLDYHLGKSPEYRPGESLCSGQSTHFYMKWYKTHINPRKFFDHDKKLFRKKLRTGLSLALPYGIISTLYVHGFFSQSFYSVERHNAIFIGTCLFTSIIYLQDKDYREKNIHFRFYRHPELYGFGLLILYTCWRYFKNYATNTPIRRVLLG